ncbi:oxygenase MpaB family protein [Williamsia sp.]|uniref:oxygenase MpaB family protein n=1 Tax=Williamsia sp. TaxID=1872085 RepID=UPI002F93AA3A
MVKQPPTELVDTDEAIARYGDAGRIWLDAMWSADPLADAVAADTFTGTSGTAAVRAALVGDVESVTDAPTSLRELFAFLDDEPEWVDHTRLDHAADVLVRHTAALGIVLGAASLVRGAGNTIAGKPLALTGRYTSMPAIRSVEVGEWLRAVLTPSGMRRGGDGFAYTVRVRVIHAHVRRGLLMQGVWVDASWGVPIPQPYMAFTLAEFGHIALEAMHKVGVRLTDHELDDIYHLWRYVGHVIGVEPELNPCGEADHVRIEGLYRLTSPGPGDDDRDFVRALTYDYLVPELANLIPGPDQMSRMRTNYRVTHDLVDAAPPTAGGSVD